MCNLIQRIAFGAALASAGLATHAGVADGNPTIVLVHGAFAEPSSWSRVIAEFNKDGHRTIAAANPLRSVKADVAVVSAVVAFIEGSVVPVGCSYGGPVVTEAANGRNNVKALAYVAAFAADAGGSGLMLSARFPGSTPRDALVTVEPTGGGPGLYITTEKFRDPLAADVPATEAGLMAATQRPVTAATLAEPSTAPAWKTIPSHAVYGSDDRNIPSSATKFAADRARPVRMVVVEGASHSLTVFHPDEVASLIEDAATGH